MTKKTWDRDLYSKALLFAANAHKGQKLPGSDLPYIIHPASVAMEVMYAINVEGLTDPDMAIQCALLHDVLEDTDVHYHQIESTFGENIAQGVLALSKNRELPKYLRIRDSIERILKMPEEIAVVKLADRIINLAPPPSHWDKEKILEYKEESIYILEQLGHVSHVLSGRLKFKLSSYGV